MEIINSHERVLAMLDGLLSRKEYRSCVVLLLIDRDTQRVYRLHGFSKTHHLVPGQACCASVGLHN